MKDAGHARTCAALQEVLERRVERIEAAIADVVTQEQVSRAIQHALAKDRLVTGQATPPTPFHFETRPGTTVPSQPVTTRRSLQPKMSTAARQKSPPVRERAATFSSRGPLSAPDHASTSRAPSVQPLKSPRTKSLADGKLEIPKLEIPCPRTPRQSARPVQASDSVPAERHGSEEAAADSLCQVNMHLRLRLREDQSPRSSQFEVEVQRLRGEIEEVDAKVREHAKELNRCLDDARAAVERSVSEVQRLCGENSDTILELSDSVKGVNQTVVDMRVSVADKASDVQQLAESVAAVRAELADKASHKQIVQALLDMQTFVKRSTQGGGNQASRSIFAV
uniref:Uncharacterized protein n=1 Tax=Noctiluca scintillans TaxID=2966 RepID=A0A7S1AIR3_NOCSC|mmetsp:Transcript_47944/g.126975  ORF Transcript_47944/g.126975 Transcript_47944/m.126975 type:complete len:338 (+) Transcript_47944:54-1067(+)